MSNTVLSTSDIEPAARLAADTGSARPVFAALQARRSHSKVTDEAPTRKELAHILSAMNAVADHSNLRPWRIIEMRGKGRSVLGKALAKADGGSRAKVIAKAKRAPLVLAIVVSPRKSGKVPVWEQEAVASGVAHYLELLLQEAGWGSFWRTGSLTRTKPVRKAMKLESHEHLLGWLYVGGIPPRDRKPKRRRPLDLSRHLTSL
ncbi:MAG: nitroreductase family protein [Leucobacter sp.]